MTDPRAARVRARCFLRLPPLPESLLPVTTMVSGLACPRCDDRRHADVPPSAVRTPGHPRAVAARGSAPGRDRPQRLGVRASVARAARPAIGAASDHPSAQARHLRLAVPDCGTARDRAKNAIVWPDPGEKVRKLRENAALSARAQSHHNPGNKPHSGVLSAWIAPRRSGVRVPLAPLRPDRMLSSAIRAFCCLRRSSTVGLLGHTRGARALASGPNRVFGGHTRRVVELVDHVSIRRQSHTRVVPQLARNVDHAAALVQQ
jgi:hypothetical protein